MKKNELEMQIKKWMKRWQEIGLFRIGLLVVAGLLLLVASLPAKEEQKEEGEAGRKSSTVFEETEELEKYVGRMEERLTNLLSKVEGMGEVQVMITARSTKEEVVLKDTPYSRSDTTEQDSQGGTRKSTEINSQEGSVLEKQEDGSESPYITKELQPEIEGVVVIAQGADDTKIVAEINEAVEALFSVPSHKIKVMKMK